MDKECKYFYAGLHPDSPLIPVYTAADQEGFEKTLVAKGILNSNPRCIRFIDASGQASETSWFEGDSLFVIPTEVGRKTVVRARSWDEAKSQFNSRKAP